MPNLRDPQPTTYIGLERPTTHDLRRTCHDPRRTWCTHDSQWSHDPWRRRREYGHTAWSGGLWWPMMVVACGRASDSGSGHGGSVMVFISTMGFGFEDERAKQEREGRKRKWKEIMRKEEREESDNKKLIFYYTMLLQFHLTYRMVLQQHCNFFLQLAVRVMHHFSGLMLKYSNI